MTYIWIIKPLARLFLVAALAFVGLKMLRAASELTLTQSIAPSLVGFAFIAAAAYLFPHLGDIARSYMKTWRPRP